MLSMQWNIPDIPDIPKPERHQWNTFPVWLIGLLFLYLTITPVVWLIWGEAAHSILFWAILLLLPLAILGISWFSVFSWEMGNEHRYHAWEREKEKIRQRWQIWAKQRIAILDSNLYLPGGLDLELLLSQKQDIPALFTRKQGSVDVEPDIYTRFATDILHLADVAGNKGLTIHLTSGSQEVSASQIQKIKTAATTLGLDVSRWSFAATGNHLENIGKWFERQPIGIHVVFSVALNGEGVTPFTENACWLAFASAEEAKQADWPIQSWLQRPAEMPSENDEEFGKAVRYFAEYGLAECKVEALWDGGLEAKSLSALRKLFGQPPVNRHLTDDFTEKAISRNLCGLPPNIAWLALSCLQQSHARQENLMTWQKGNSVFLVMLVNDKLVN